MIKQNGYWTLESQWILYYFRALVSLLPLIRNGATESSVGSTDDYDVVWRTSVHMSPSYTEALLDHQNDMFEALTSENPVFSSLSFKLTVAFLKILLIS